MHEASLAENILAIADRERESAGASRVTGIELEIGLLSAVEPEALRFAIDALLPGSVACGAQVEYRCVQGLAHCRDCDASFELEFLYDPCPGCASFNKSIEAGEELLVRRITVA